MAPRRSGWPPGTCRRQTPTTAVRGGLASTAKDPARPASRLPGPDRRQVHVEVLRGWTPLSAAPGAAKRRTSGGRGLHGAQERHRDGGAHELAQLVQAGIGERQPGQGGITGPTIFTPWLTRPAALTSAVAPTIPIKAPGIRRSTLSQTTMMTSTPMAMAKDQPLNWLSWSKKVRTRPMVVVPRLAGRGQSVIV